MKEMLWFAGKILIELVPLFAVATYLSALVARSMKGAAFSHLLRTRRGDLSGRMGAALAGAVTPFCSCGSVPIVAGLLRAQVPLGIALTFLVSSPLVDITSSVLLLTFFGWKVLVAYVGFSLVIALVGALMIEKLVPPAHALRALPQAADLAQSIPRDSWQVRHKDSVREVWHELRKLAPWLLVAAGVGALVQGYMPEQWVSLLGAGNVLWAVPLAVLVGIPVYAPTALLLPLAAGLVAKGAAVSVVIAFVMAASGLSLPEGVMLSRFFRPRLLTTFFTVVGVGIVLAGYMIGKVV
ncbi:MAG: permease [Mycobacterium leprae]